MSIADSVLLIWCLYVNDHQLKSATTECRSAKSDCDLPEYCDGQDHLCPSDVYRRNTDECSVDGVCCHTVLTLFNIKTLQELLIVISHHHHHHHHHQHQHQWDFQSDINIAKTTVKKWRSKDCFDSCDEIVLSLCQMSAYCLLQRWVQNSPISMSSIVWWCLG